MKEDPMADKILEVKNLKTYFRTDAGLVKAVSYTHLTLPTTPYV